jgi:hypothetical protein
MLAAPDASLGPAGRPTPRRLELLADWIELAALQEDVELYRHNVTDMLSESYFVSGQDDAASNVAEAWRLLRRRQRIVGKSYPFELDDDFIARRDLNENITYGFLLVLAAPEFLSEFNFGTANAFRNLFELVTVEAVRNSLPGWDVYWCGATSKEMRAAGGVVHYVAQILRTAVRDDTFFRTAQDGGLDFIAVWSGADQRSARPALWGQCASGLKWQDKFQEPNFALWSDAIRVLPRAVRAFAVPFSLDDHTFTDAAVKGEAWVLDRLRIASAVHHPGIEKLSGTLREWVWRQLARLPLDT